MGWRHNNNTEYLSADMQIKHDKKCTEFWDDAAENSVHIITSYFIPKL